MYSIRRHLLHSNVVCVGTNRGVLVLRLDAGSEPQVGFRSIPGFGNFSLLSKQDGCGTIKGDPGNVSERSQASASCSGQLLPSVSAWQIAQSGYIWRAQVCLFFVNSFLIYMYVYIYFSVYLPGWSPCILFQNFLPSFGLKPDRVFRVKMLVFS